MVNATYDVNAALRRSRQALSEQLHQATSASTILEKGRESLYSSDKELQQLHDSIIRSKKLIYELKKKAQMDKIWIMIGITLYLFVILFIIYERINISFINMGSNIYFLFMGNYNNTNTSQLVDSSRSKMSEL